MDARDQPGLSTTQPETTAAGASGLPTGIDESIGPYHLRRALGEGGMGIVFLAEQLEPIRRLVALKLVKAGFDTRGVLARFDSERQALAIMNHPNIAHVFDAGTTAAGRPFFVME